MEKILVIDDDPQVLESLQGVLAASGYEVETASTGSDAVSKAMKTDFALVITDVRMPGMDGIAALKKLAAYQPQARKLVITGYAEYDAPVRAIQISVDDYLMKPFGADLLLRSIRNALSRYHLERQKADIVRMASQTVSVVFQFILSNVEEIHPERKGFSQKLSALCGQIAEALDLGLLQIERVRKAAALHDLGFISFPNFHAQKSAEILKAAREYEEIAPILENHHKRSRGEDKSVPVESRILGLAEDYCNSLDSQGNSPKNVFQEIINSNEYDPDLLSALSRVVLREPAETPAKKDSAESDLKTYERLLHLAQAYTLAGETDTARDVLKQMEYFPAESKREDFRSRILLVSSQNLIRQKKFLEGYQEAERALEIALSLNLGSLFVARIFLELSLAKLCLSNLEQVQEMLEKSDETFEKFQDFQSRSRALLYLAIYFHLSEQKEKGTKCLESCLKLIPTDQFEEWLESESLALSLPAGEIALGYFTSRLSRTEETLRIHTLGPFRVYRKGRLVKEKEWKSKKAKNILAFLLLNKQKPVTEERLCEIFWGDSDFDRSKKSLYQTIYLLRHILQPGETEGDDSSYILSKRNSYQFNQEIPSWWDVEQLTSHFQAAEEFLMSGEKEKAISFYQKVESLYEGELLEDSPSETWCDNEREKLKEMHEVSLLRLAQEDEEQKRFPVALDRINRVLAGNPMNEQATTERIRILFKSGQRSEAIRRYHDWRGLLKRETNLEPSPELLALYLEMTSADSPA